VNFADFRKKVRNFCKKPAESQSSQRAGFWFDVVLKAGYDFVSGKMRVLSEPIMARMEKFKARLS
jgi:hypothetical protein